MTTRFDRSVAVVIGINDYTYIRPLGTAVADATRLATTLADEHGYSPIFLLTSGLEPVTKARLTKLFDEELPQTIRPNDRLLIYFGGHGIALNADDGPEGFLIPQDARSDDRQSFIAMGDLYEWVSDLACRHLLLILDCCFAGAFTWYGRRDLRMVPEQLYQEHYDRFVREPAWQILTSTAYDQEALDVLDGKAIGVRGAVDDGTRHSPFAKALFAALDGAGDLIPGDEGDGVVTATELYLYLRNYVELQAEELVGHYQTPELWPFSRAKHGKGEYIFLVPGHGELELEPAPPLAEKNNPYVGLRSFEADDAPLFFGRGELIETLAQRVDAGAVTVVLGASGTGKSSLVKAGLAPYLANREKGIAYRPLPPMRTGDTPTETLAELLRVHLPGSSQLSGRSAVKIVLSSWCKAYPNQRLMLIVDQFEELVTLCTGETRAAFLTLLADLVEAHSDQLRLVITLRTDFEPQFDDTPLNGFWQGGRFFVSPMSQSDLRDVIEEPAAARVLFFDPPELVDDLIDEVLLTPGALPLLSFTLSELYLKYLKRQEAAQLADETLDRALIQADYEAMGGVIGSLRRRANEVYAELPDEAHRETMERIMLRMVAVEGGELARRRVPRAELVYSSEEENERVAEVLRRLIAARLVVVDSANANDKGNSGASTNGDAYVEPAHDALVRAWDRLLRWKQSFEESLPLQRRLTAAANDWAAEGGHPKSGLLWDSNPRLPQLESILTGAQHRNLNPWLNRSESAFVEKSIQRARAIQRRVWASWGAVSLLVLIAAVVGTFLFNQATAAEEREALTEQLKRAIQADQLTSTALRIVEDDAPLAALIAVEGIRRQRDKGEDVVESAQDNLRALLDLVGGKPIVRQADVSAVRYSPSGQWLVVAHDSAIELRNATEPQVTVRTLSGHLGSVDDMEFSQDERYLASVGGDGEVRLWDLVQGDFRVLCKHGSGLADVSFTADDQWLVSLGEGDGRLCVSLVATLADAPRVLDTFDFPVTPDLASFPQGSRFVTTSYQDEIGEYTVEVWDLEQPVNPQRTFQAYWDIDHLAVSPDGRWIAGAPWDGSFVFLWDMALPDAQESKALVWDEEWRECNALTGSTSGNGPRRTDPLAFSPGGRWLAVGERSQFAAVRIWDLEALDNPAVLLCGHRDDVAEVVFSRNGDLLATAGADSVIRVWDVTRLTAEPLRILRGHGDRIIDLAFAPSGRRLLSGSLDSSARLWDLSSPNAASIEVGTQQSSQPRTAMFSPDGRWLVNDGLEAHDRVDPSAPSRMFNISSSALAFAHHANRLAVGTLDGGVVLWDIDQEREQRLTESSNSGLQATLGRVAALAFSSDDRWLVAASNGNMSGDGESALQLWDLSSASPTAQPLPFPDGFNVSALAFADDDKTLYGATTSGRFNENEDGAITDAFVYEIVMWDVENLQNPPQRELLFTDSISAIGAVEFSPNGRLLLSGTYQGVRISDLDDLQDGSILSNGLTIDINRAAFSRDASWLATSGPEIQLIRFDDFADGTPLTIRSHRGPVSDVDFSPDGKWLASAGYDDVLRLSKVHLEDLTKVACEVAGRNLRIGSPEMSNQDPEWVDEWTQYRLDDLYRPTCPENPLAPSTIEYVTNEAKEFAEQGDLSAAANRLKELSHWLKENGQFGEYGAKGRELLDALNAGKNPWADE